LVWFESDTGSVARSDADVDDGGVVDRRNCYRTAARRSTGMMKFLMPCFAGVAGPVLA
jgi:hypothetical protein